jgi:hypothetical protein
MLAHCPGRRSAAVQLAARLWASPAFPRSSFTAANWLSDLLHPDPLFATVKGGGAEIVFELRPAVLLGLPAP